MSADRAGRSVQALITRPPEEAAALAAMLAARGVRAVIEPLLRICWREGVSVDLAGVQAILCTSANGARALARASGERDLPLYAVGEATAARALALGFARVESAGGNAADLARLVAARLRPQEGRLLHVAGAALAGDLVGELRDLGFDAVREVLYEARPAATLTPATVLALASGALDLALFFSPRTAAVFVRLAGLAGVGAECRRLTALSISPAADAALDALPWGGRRIAQRPAQQALLAVLDQVLDEMRGAVAGNGPWP